MKRVVAAGLVSAALSVLLPPVPAAATLGSYSASAEASIVRIGIFEPAIPIPAEPQVDASIGFARATTANGPSARGLASYLWPGDAVGDGLGVLLGNEALEYPVKTSSSFPATETGPAQNAVQINDGNGMSTSADGRTTRATVVGLGLGNGVGDPGGGLCERGSQCPDQPPAIDLPDPIAAAAVIENLKSQSTVVLDERGITATARSVASGISVLGGLITIDGMDMRSEARSDGAAGTAAGTANITGLNVLGQKVDLGNPVRIGGAPTPLPDLPQVLEQLGITITYLENRKTVAGPAGSVDVQGLTISLDVAPLRDLLMLGGLAELLAPAFVNVDQVGPLLHGLLKLGTKVVITVGDVRTRAVAAPAYQLPSSPTGETPPGSVEVGGPAVPGAITPPDLVPGPLAPTATPPTVTVAPASIELPGLGRVPTWFVLAGLTFVALAAWMIRGFGTWVLGGGTCHLGTSIGVPDLRKAFSP